MSKTNKLMGELMTCERQSLSVGDKILALLELEFPKASQRDFLISCMALVKSCHVIQTEMSPLMKKLVEDYRKSFANGGGNVS